MAMIEDLLLFADTETTGLTFGKDKVIEFAGILTDLRGNEISRLERKIEVDPELVTPEAAAVNGYDKDVWEKEAVPFQEVQDWLKKHIQYRHVAVLVGMNPSFDRRMIDEGHYKPAFCPISYHVIDVASFSLAMKVAGKMATPDVKLATVLDYLGFPEQTHRAMDDVLGAKCIFDTFVDIIKEIDVVDRFKKRTLTFSHSEKKEVEVTKATRPPFPDGEDDWL